MSIRVKKPCDTLEQIVADAIERERIINEQHPERHGYGMIQGEANDLIHRIEHLEHNQLRAQAAKVKHREDKIRVIGSDKLYTHSPEDIVIERLERKRISNAEKKVLNNIPIRSQRFYFLRDIGLNYTDIAKVFDLHRTTVSRELKRVNDNLKQEFKEIFKGGDNHIHV